MKRSTDIPKKPETLIDEDLAPVALGTVSDEKPKSDLSMLTQGPVGGHRQDDEDEYGVFEWY